MNQEDNNTLNKYLNGTASVDEQASIEKVLSSIGEMRDIEGFIKNDWLEYLESNEIVDKDMNSVLDKIHHTLHFKEVRVRQTVSHKIYRL